MLPVHINGKATFYLSPDRETAYTRLTLPVYWEERVKFEYGETPTLTKLLKLYVPLVDGLSISANDINRVVLGECEYNGDDETALVRDYGALKIMSVQEWRAGNRKMWHWEMIIGARDGRQT